MTASAGEPSVPDASPDHGRIVNHRLLPPAGVFQIDP